MYVCQASSSETMTPNTPQEVDFTKSDLEPPAVSRRKLRWVVPEHLQSSSSLSFSAMKPSCGIMLGWPAAENVVRKIKWHLKQSSVMQALNNCSYRGCYGTCDFCSYHHNCIDNSAYQYLAMAQNISKFFKPLLFTSGIAGQWMFMPGRMFASFPPRGSPPKLLPSAAALLRADVWLPRVLWRLPAGRVWQHGSKFQIWTIRLDRCLVAFLVAFLVIRNRSIDPLYTKFLGSSILACLLSTPIIPYLRSWIGWACLCLSDWFTESSLGSWNLLFW